MYKKIRIPKTLKGKKVMRDISRKPTILKGYTVFGSKMKGSRNLLFKTKAEAKKFTGKIGGTPRKAYRADIPIKLNGKKGWFNISKPRLMK